MAGIIEDEGLFLSPLNVGAILLTAALSAGIIWNAVMQQPVATAGDAASGAARVVVSSEDAPGGTITLRFDPAIEDVQKALAAAGYYSGPVDGVMGRRTKTAIESFQSANGLDITGTATPELAERIRFTQQIAEAAGITSSTTATPQPDSVLLQVQKDLSELGYAPGTIDGNMGEQTREAIRSFERDRGLTVTGNVSDSLLTELAKTTDHASKQTQ